MKKPSRHWVVTVAAAVGGLCVAVALAIATSDISAQRIGLAGESPTIGRQLVAPPVRPKPATAKRDTAGQDRKTKQKTKTKTKTTAASPTAPTVTPSPGPAPSAPATTPSSRGTSDDAGRGSGDDGSARVETHTTEGTGETHTTEVHPAETESHPERGNDGDDD